MFARGAEAFGALAAGLGQLRARGPFHVCASRPKGQFLWCNMGPGTRRAAPACHCDLFNKGGGGGGLTLSLSPMEGNQGHPDPVVTVSWPPTSH